VVQSCLVWSAKQTFGLSSTSSARTNQMICKWVQLASSFISLCSRSTSEFRPSDGSSESLRTVRHHTAHSGPLSCPWDFMLWTNASRRTYL